MIYIHRPVLLKEAIDLLNVRENEWYIDATAGGGGYTFEILERGGKVLAIDADQDAIDNIKCKVQSATLRFNSGREFKVNLGRDLILVQGNFKDIDEIAKVHGFEQISGIVFDLGLSSYQLESSGRGFSFLRDEPLDMRMNSSASSGQVTAADIINTWTEEELYELFSKMGEERYAHAVAENIIKSRRIKPIERSLELVRIVQDSIPEKRKTHPATKVFQALRIAVNNEIGSLNTAIEKGFSLLKKDGRMVIVSFHSLEDRTVKRFFREFEHRNMGKIITKKPVTASTYEIEENVRARSAKLRVIEKII